MKIKNIHPSWCSIIELDSIEEFFEQPSDHWRNMIYDRKLIFFKKVGFTKEQYAEFSLRFGAPWTKNDYVYSQEFTESLDTRAGSLVISPFNTNIVNKERINMSEMPWHADIPNRIEKPFPFRSLWITSNPNPSISGQTIWLNLEQAVDLLTPELLDLANRLTVIQQSWYKPGTDLQEFSFIKTHPITGKRSLRLNWLCRPDRTDAWIKSTKLDGVLQPDNRLLQEFYQYLTKFPELYYKHVWDTFDIAIYDNWPFVHRRTKLDFDAEKEYREFLRINIDHVSNADWPAHVDKYKN
jgi:alpha-ketoglutarate-dependent taurine dioxygenase